MKRLRIVSVIVVMVGLFLIIGTILNCDDLKIQSSDGSDDEGLKVTLSPDDITQHYACMNEIKLPEICYDTWKEYFIALCVYTESTNPTLPEIVECVGQGADPTTCAEYWCDDGDLWIRLTENEEYLEDARSNIGTNLGACGNLNTVVTAAVTDEDGKPMSSVDVCFCIEGCGEFYSFEEVPGEIAPLETPFIIPTDEQGLASVKVRAPWPTSCGSTITCIITAHIDCDCDQTEIQFTFDELSD